MKAINQAMAQVKTQAIRGVTSTYNLTAAVVRPGIQVFKASTDSLTSQLRSSKQTIPMINFKPTEVREGMKTKFKGSRKNGSFVSSKTREAVTGVTVDIFRGKSVTLRNAFLAVGGTVSDGVKAYGRYTGGSFTWNESGDGKTSRLNTLSIAGALKNDKLIRSLQDKAMEIYSKTYLSQLQNIGKY